MPHRGHRRVADACRSDACRFHRTVAGDCDVGSDHDTRRVDWPRFAGGMDDTCRIGLKPMAGIRIDRVATGRWIPIAGFDLNAQSARALSNLVLRYLCFNPAEKPTLQSENPSMKLRLILATLVALTSTPALAELSVTFREGAPKDRFIVQNTGACDLGPATLAIDLSNTNGKLIFDVTAAGAGVEVFQPLEVVTGASALSSVPSVRDGDSVLELQIETLAANSEIVLTVDVDDTIGAREITVNGSEFEGATLFLSGEQPARFETTSRPQASIEICT